MKTSDFRGDLTSISAKKTTSHHSTPKSMTTIAQNKISRHCALSIEADSSDKRSYVVFASEYVLKLPKKVLENGRHILGIRTGSIQNIEDHTHMILEVD